MNSDRPERLEPLIVHPLPVAPVFLGREPEIARMEQSMQRGGVLSLVGVGGSGKTATVERFVRKLIEDGQCDSLLIWSFYDDPDTNAFLRTAVEYLTGDAAVTGQGSGWFQILKQAILARPRSVFILDGLERVQRPITSSTGIYGELEDPLLKALLARIATAGSGAKAIVTSRFPLSDLDRLSSGYEVIDVDHLPVGAARSLLASHGVAEDTAAQDRVLDHFGRHALTVDLLGAATREFFGGDVSQVPIQEAVAETKDPQSGRLSQVLALFDKGLTAKQHDMMSRLCVFRFGVDLETLAAIFAKNDSNIAGSLAGANTDDVHAITEELAAMHLLYKEHGRYSVHPAVRDHFYALFRESAQVHGAITKHLISLSDRPGVGLPTSKEALDLLEELVFHALRAHKPEEAREIYAYRLGGNDHLNTRLGEYSRTYRILQAFDECPDPGGMYHCLRAFGDYDSALKWRPQNRYIQIAQGRLAALAHDPAEATRAMARFLMGERVSPPERTPDFPITAGWLFALQGRLDNAERKCEEEIRLSLYEDDIARNRIALVDVLIKQGRLKEASTKLEEISTWVLGSGSQEHLCLYHLVAGRFELARQNPTGSVTLLSESLQLAREAGFDLFAVDVLVSLSLASREPGDAIESAKEALELSRAEAMMYAWGEVASLMALARAFRAKGDDAEYRSALKQALETQIRIGHADTATTQRLLSAS